MSVSDAPIGSMSMAYARPTSARREKLANLYFVLFFGMFAILWAREFAVPEGFPSRIYEDLGGGLRAVDIIVVAAFSMVFLARLAVGAPLLPRATSGLVQACVLFGVSIVLAMINGASKGGTELFFDWRNVFLGALFAIGVYQLAAPNPQRARYAVAALLAFIALRSGTILLRFFAGVDVIVLFGVPVPAFDGPTLSNAVFLAIGAGCFALLHRNRTLSARVVAGSASLIGMVLVLLAFRRTYWGEILVGAIVIFIMLRKRRMAIAAAVLLASALVYSYLGEAYRARIASVNPLASDNPYALTNQDHIDDLADAWDVIRKDPILGFGLGRPYFTERIENWKPISWGVHNAILHVWLRYGVLGLIAYVAAHAALFRWLSQLRRRLPEGSFEQVLVMATFAYIVGTFVMSLAFSPWPYGALQNSVVIFSLVGIALAVDRHAREKEEGERALSELTA